ncbi:MAG: helix-turn-helix domain-containing protein [Candidatus Gracilibacteria bacterium]|nr:helix-turn-helix domain-containing protein [Candidatus Gracilibacteria bacterium]MDQ7022352.1 helix-turn-helix domain-containing protein [Candidatus Gracilibacteria bacterium]
MEEKLIELGFNKKEIKVFLYLLEFGISAASEVARNLGFPKSSVNFLADNLWKKGVLKKSFRGKTGYYESDISNFEKIILEEIKNKKSILEDILPKLKEKNQNNIYRPKIIFIDGIENCKKAYLEIIEFSKNKNNTKYCEIGAHKDLVNTFGEEFMNNFIKLRKKYNLICDAISNNGETESQFKNKNYSEERELQLFDENIFGKIYSTIVIYNNKVLILNLRGNPSGVLIENKDFYETMKILFKIAKK